MAVTAQLHDGRTLEFPDGTDPAVVQATVKKVLGVQPEPSTMDAFAQGAKNLAGGLVRGAGSIGATIVDLARSKLADDVQAATPVNMRPDVSKELPSLPRGNAIRQGMDAGLQEMGADPSSPTYQGGKLLGEIGGTAGAGGATANALTRLVPAVARSAPGLVEAIRTGGFSSGGAGLLPRVAGGAVTGGISAGMVNPEDAAKGATIGGGLPAAAQVGGLAAKAAGAGIRRALAGSGGVSPEVRALAQRAQELGIDIPADRVVNSRPLNAMAASLNYVPLSGRAATEAKMSSQLNTALSRTFGQDSDNVTMALRKASDALGKQFDEVLSKNGVRVDESLLNDLAQHEQRAMAELPFSTGHHASASGNVIKNQIDQIIEKGASGTIDGQAAYNIKKALDRIGNGKSEAAYYARDLKKSLMEALNRSLGPDQAAGFAKLRQQYGNMIALENLAQNGAEGGVSVGRLANLKNINNPDLQELADIAAQFVKSRESAHGAAQRVSMGGMTTALGGWVGGPVGAATGFGALAGAGRTANAALNSDALRSVLLNQPVGITNNALLNALERGGYRVAPVLSAQ